MADRICLRCRNIMQPVKNGFHFTLPDGNLYTCDLWGCKRCSRYQIHGCPGQPMLKIFGFVDSGYFRPDQGEMAENFRMIGSPVIRFTPYFEIHMAEWYPGWKF